MTKEYMTWNRATAIFTFLRFRHLWKLFFLRIIVAIYTIH